MTSPLRRKLPTTLRNMPTCGSGTIGSCLAACLALTTVIAHAEIRTRGGHAPASGLAEATETDSPANDSPRSAGKKPGQPAGRVTMRRPKAPATRAVRPAGFEFAPLPEAVPELTEDVEDLSEPTAVPPRAGK